jgi:predicted RNA-binding protein with PIN domain
LGTEGTVTASSEERSLPADVRRRLISIAADFVGSAALPELPASVRRFARFAPAKRLRMGAAEIATALAVDERFREAVAAVVTEVSPELADQVLAGTVPATADPVDVGVILYLLRPTEWQQRLEAIADSLAGQHRQEHAEAELQTLRAAVERLSATNADLSQAREAAKAAVKTVNAKHAEIEAELRRQLRTAQAELRQARRAEQEANQAVAELRAEYERGTAAESQELRKARARISALEAELEASRRSSRTGREHDDARVWVLLETLTSAAAGLRRELDVSNPGVRPADLVTGEASRAGRRPSTVDSSLLDRMLDGSHVHLIVDGYNLTKTGYPSLPLADQRSRLVASLGPLAARTGVEVTVAFDGTAAPAGAAASVATPRGVRVLFSAPGQLADDLIRDLLATEPAGRTVLVASSDQAVAASVRAAGGWPIPATVLLSRLERG